MFVTEFFFQSLFFNISCMNMPMNCIKQCVAFEDISLWSRKEVGEQHLKVTQNYLRLSQWREKSSQKFCPVWAWRQWDNKAVLVLIYVKSCPADGVTWSPLPSAWSQITDSKVRERLGHSQLECNWKLNVNQLSNHKQDVGGHVEWDRK